MPFPVEILIGSVFLGGSIFVYVVVRTTSITLSNIGEKEREILMYTEKMSVASAELREMNESL